MRPSTLMNIAKVQGELAADGIHLNQQENQWHTFTFAKALIGSSKIQQFTHERNGSGVQGDQLICNRNFFFFKTTCPSKNRRLATDEEKPKQNY